MNGRLWITWERQRRNRTLSKEVNAELVEYPLDLPRLLRYPVLLIRTFLKIVFFQPSILFVQNPSIVLTFLAVITGKLVGVPVVVDAHNAGVFPFDRKKKWANKITDIISRWASYTIVSNDSLKEYVEKTGGRSLALPDPIPMMILSKDLSDKMTAKFRVLFVCTWADDEPFNEVIDAANGLDDSVHIYITGNSRHVSGSLLENVPSAVTLTGFLSDEEYEKLLSEVDVVMDLTTLDDCLVCGAYESVGAGKPIILSDNTASRAYFTKGSVHIQNTVDGITEGIQEAQANISMLRKDILDFREEAQLSWQDLILDANAKFSCLEK